MKAIKFFFFSLMCLMALNLSAQQYVDLGLPSGIKWKSANEKGFYLYDEAISTFGNSVPSQEQWMELRNECVWTWGGRGYKVVGPNGNSIFLPAAGFRYVDGDVIGVGRDGRYWSSTLCGSVGVWYLYIFPSEVGMDDIYGFLGFSVRLVQGK